MRETVIAPQPVPAGSTETPAPGADTIAAPVQAPAKVKKAKVAKKEKVSTAGKALPCTGTARCRCHPSRKFCANKPPAVATPKIEPAAAKS